MSTPVSPIDRQQREEMDDTVFRAPKASPPLETTPIDISGNGGVLKTIISATTGEIATEVSSEQQVPRSGQEVEVHYVGTLEDGTQFDSSRDRGVPFVFQLGCGQVIKGWDVGVATMKKGERALLKIRADYGYGESGSPPTIPGGATLLFDVELLKFQDKKKDKYLMSPAEKLQAALEAKTKGNDLFQRKKLQEAIAEYKEAIGMFEQFDDFPQDLKASGDPIRLSAHLNLASCFLKTEAYLDASVHATQALAIAPKNCKALYRRGVARLHNDEFEEAKVDLMDAARLEPQNPEIRKQLALLKERWAVEKQKEKSTFGNLFGKVSLYTEKTGIHKQRDLTKCPKVYMDIKIGENSETRSEGEQEPSAPPQRVVMALYTDTVPKTAENFRALCTGEKKTSATTKTPLHFKGSTFHRVIRGFVMQGGDFTRGDGTGGESIYGERFNDEAFVDKHDRRGLLSMANSGPNTNGSQFFITFDTASHLDGKHMVFGEVVSGMDVIDAIEQIETGEADRPKIPITIVESGQLEE